MTFFPCFLGEWYSSLEWSHSLVLLFSLCGHKHHHLLSGVYFNWSPALLHFQNLDLLFSHLVHSFFSQFDLLLNFLIRFQQYCFNPSLQYCRKKNVFLPTFTVSELYLWSQCQKIWLLCPRMWEFSEKICLVFPVQCLTSLKILILFKGVFNFVSDYFSRQNKTCSKACQLPNNYYFFYSTILGITCDWFTTTIFALTDQITWIACLWIGNLLFDWLDLYFSFCTWHLTPK